MDNTNCVAFALCCFKSHLYLLTEDDSDPKLKNYYEIQCKISSNTTKETKRSYYNRQIFTSKNKIKFARNIVQAVTGRKAVHEDIHFLNINGNLTNNQQIICNSCNDHFFLQLIELLVKYLIIPTPIEIIAFPQNICYKLVRTLLQILNIITDQRKKFKT